jgi:hypothetical protein
LEAVRNVLNKMDRHGFNMSVHFIFIDSFVKEFRYSTIT